MTCNELAPTILSALSFHLFYVLYQEAIQIKQA